MANDEIRTGRAGKAETSGRRNVVSLSCYGWVTGCYGSMLRVKQQKSPMFMRVVTVLRVKWGVRVWVTSKSLKASAFAKATARQGRLKLGSEEDIRELREWARMSNAQHRTSNPARRRIDYDDEDEDEDEDT